MSSKTEMPHENGCSRQDGTAEDDGRARKEVEKLEVPVLPVHQIMGQQLRMQSSPCDHHQALLDQVLASIHRGDVFSPLSTGFELPSPLTTTTPLLVEDQRGKMGKFQKHRFGTPVLTTPSLQEPLFHACVARAQVSAVRLCLSTPRPLDFDTRNEYGQTIFHILAEVSSRDRAVSMLQAIVSRVKSHPTDQLNWLAKDGEGRDFFHLSAQKGRLSTFMPLLRELLPPCSPPLLSSPSQRSGAEREVSVPLTKATQAEKGGDDDTMTTRKGRMKKIPLHCEVLLEDWRELTEEDKMRFHFCYGVKEANARLSDILAPPESRSKRRSHSIRRKRRQPQRHSTGTELSHESEVVSAFGDNVDDDGVEDDREDDSCVNSLSRPSTAIRLSMQVGGGLDFATDATGVLSSPVPGLSPAERMEREVRQCVEEDGAAVLFRRTLNDDPPLFRCLLMENVACFAACLRTNPHHHPLDLCATHRDGQTILHLLCEMSNERRAVALLRVLVERLQELESEEVEVEVPWWQHDDLGRDFLSLAAESGRLSVFWPMVKPLPVFAERLDGFPRCKHHMPHPTTPRRPLTLTRRPLWFDWEELLPADRAAFVTCASSSSSSSPALPSPSPVVPVSPSEHLWHLSVSCTAPDTAMVRRCVIAGADLFYRPQQEKTGNNNTNSEEVLLTSWATRRRRDHHGTLWHLVEREYVEAVLACLAYVGPAPLNFNTATTTTTRTLLHQLCEVPSVKRASVMLSAIVQRLFTHPRDRLDWERVDEEGLTFFSLAAQEGRLSVFWPIVRRLPFFASVEQQAAIDAADTTDTTARHRSSLASPRRRIPLTLHVPVLFWDWKQLGSAGQRCFDLRLSSSSSTSTSSVALVGTPTESLVWLSCEDVPQRAEAVRQCVAAGAELMYQEDFLDEPALFRLAREADVSCVEACLTAAGSTPIDFNHLNARHQTLLHILFEIPESERAVGVLRAVLKRLRHHPTDCIDWGQQDLDGCDFMRLMLVNGYFETFWPYLVDVPYFRDQTMVLLTVAEQFRLENEADWQQCASDHKDVAYDDEDGTEVMAEEESVKYSSSYEYHHSQHQPAPRRVRDCQTAQEDVEEDVEQDDEEDADSGESVTTFGYDDVLRSIDRSTNGGSGHYSLSTSKHLPFRPSSSSSANPSWLDGVMLSVRSSMNGNN